MRRGTSDLLAFCEGLMDIIFPEDGLRLLRLFLSPFCECTIENSNSRMRYKACLWILMVLRRRVEIAVHELSCVKLRVDRNANSERPPEGHDKRLAK